MRPLAIWIIVVGVLLGAVALATTALRDTKRVFVVVDSSFPMSTVWRRVPTTLDDIDDRNYTEFALATEKSSVHTWDGQLRLGSVEAFAPCDFDDITAYPEVQDADELILITTAASCDTSGLAGWTIINLER